MCKEYENIIKKRGEVAEGTSSPSTLLLQVLHKTYSETSSVDMIVVLFESRLVGCVSITSENAKSKDDGIGTVVTLFEAIGTRRHLSIAV